MTVIVMTREMGSLGKDVAAGLAERARRKVVYHEIIEPIADKMRLRKSHVERFVDGRFGLSERLTTDKTSLCIHTAEETFRLLSDPQNAVIRGWGAVHLFRSVPHVVRVRICAPFEVRVRNMMDRLATTDRAAVEKEMRMSEEAHTAIVRRHFNVDWHDPEHYHLVLSTANLSIEACIEQVETLARQAQFQETPDSRRVADDLALEAAIRGALRRDPRTAGLALMVECTDGIAVLTGMVPDSEATQAVHDVVLGVDGVRRVKNQLRAAGLARARCLAES